jgi:hypothetical protein
MVMFGAIIIGLITVKRLLTKIYYAFPICEIVELLYLRSINLITGQNCFDELIPKDKNKKK